MARFVLVSLELNPCSEYPLIAFNRKLKPSWAEWSSCFLQASPKFRGMTWKIALTWFMYICVRPAAEKSSQLNLNFLVFSPLFQDLRTTTMSGPSPIQTPTPSSSVSTSAALKHSTACWKRFDALFFFLFFFFLMPLSFKRWSSSLRLASQLQTFLSFDLSLICWQKPWCIKLDQKSGSTVKRIFYNFFGGGGCLSHVRSRDVKL